MRSIYCFLVAFSSLMACSEISKNTVKPSPNETVIIDEIVNDNPSENAPIPDNRFSDTYQILIFGNSHISGLGTLIERLLTTAKPDANITVVNGGGGFLDNNSSRQHRKNLIESTNWTHLILQGQKYSQSGARIYPTTSAEFWIETAKQHAITPILFPEHPQKGNTEEGRKVHQIHIEISKQQQTCIAPVGLTWDKAIIIQPSLTLHNRDGNHASVMGKLLTAYVFYEVITGQPADLLPYIAEVDVDEDTQQFLRQIASDTIQINTPCVYN